MDVRLEIPSDAAPIRAVLEAAFPRATEAESVDELRRAGDVAFSLAAVDGVRIVGCVVFSEMVAPFPPAGARAGRRAARATALRRLQSLDSRRFGSLRSWRLGSGFRSRQSRLLRPLRISRGPRERIRIALTSARISWRWRWREASGGRTAASWDMPTPSPRWDSSTRVPNETMPPFLD
jgi:hypothetical protein